MTLMELAERCEKATASDHRALLLEAYEAVLPENSGDLLRYVEADAFLDAAMTLAVEGVSAPDVLRHAIKQCTHYGEPTFIEALPRFVAAQWLRARAQ